MVSPRADEFGPFLSSGYDLTHDRQEIRFHDAPSNYSLHYRGAYIGAAATIQAELNPVTRIGTGNLPVAEIAAECYYAKLSRALQFTVSLAGTKVCNYVLY